MNRADRRFYAKNLEKYEKRLRGLVDVRVADVVVTTDDLASLTDEQRRLLRQRFELESKFFSAAAEYMDFHRSGRRS